MKKGFIEEVYKATLCYLESMPKEKRKEIGQFFTSVETARYMASMFSNVNKKELNILDPGAGSGILSAAVIEHLENESNVRKIKLTCYENNIDVIPVLKSNLEYLKKRSNIAIEYQIIEENYITSQHDEFNCTLLSKGKMQKYDWVISNPPYKKIPKDAKEAISMTSLCHGAPNLYFLFVSMGLFNLDSQGEMVYIIPRSWTSGAYFKKFREYLFSQGKVRHVHLFVSRDKVFENETVLQETIIIKIDKKDLTGSIKITSSETNKDFDNIRMIEVPYDTVISGSEKFVYLVTSEEELKVLEILGKWDETLPSIGLKMRTGITVDFRSKEYLRNESGEDIVPLIYAQHIKEGKVVFPIQKEYEYITTERSGLIQKNKNYLLVKRFTTKEEKRRLQCGIYLSSLLPQYQYISTQNKVNFIEGIETDMSEELVYGLYGLFNSTIYDLYYRILNGSTQVNSTEINTMPVPKIAEIEQIGKALINNGDLSVEACDKILEGYLMNKKGEAREILNRLDMPERQQADICCYSLLAMAGIEPSMSWKEATNEWVRIHDIIQYTEEHYEVKYAENSRETFRKQAIHHFRNAALIEDNGKATNSPNYRYRITSEALELIQAFKTKEWESKLNDFKEEHQSLKGIYASKKEMTKMPVMINEEAFTFSTGSHNKLQKLIIEEFAPRFAPLSECLYVGDTIEKDLVKNTEKLSELGFEITLHDKMPDVVLYRPDKDWIYFIEAVTSVGPMDPKRIKEIEEMTQSVKSGKIYVTAFLDFKTFKKFSEQLAWETEVWIADMPDHMVHLNGDRFLGPRN